MSAPVCSPSFLSRSKRTRTGSISKAWWPFPPSSLYLRALKAQTQNTRSLRGSKVLFEGRPGVRQEEGTSSLAADPLWAPRTESEADVFAFSFSFPPASEARTPSPQE